MKKVLSLTILLGLILFGVGCISSSPTVFMGEWRETEINGKQISLEVVTSSVDVQQGLGDRASMPEDHGMLFEFAEPAQQSFWMRHMQFPLDMVFILNNQVVDIAKNMPPPKETFGIPKTYNSNVEANKVLELNAGGVEKYGIEKGQSIFDAITSENVFHVREAEDSIDSLANAIERNDEGLKKLDK